MKKFYSLIAMLIATPALADGIPAIVDGTPYVLARLGVANFGVDTTQYHYMNAQSPRSTIVDDKITDLGATYHVGIGYDFNLVRVDAEYSYGRYKFDGMFHMLGINPGFYPEPQVETTPYLGYKSTYNLTDSVHSLTLNAHVDILRFGRRYERETYNTYGDTGALLGYNSIFLTGGLGYAHIKETASVAVDTSDIWPGGPVYASDASDTSSHFTYSLGAGVSFWLVQNLNLDLEYRYGNFGSVSAHLMSRKYSAHELSTGLRYTF